MERTGPLSQILPSGRSEAQLRETYKRDKAAVIQRSGHSGAVARQGLKQTLQTTVHPGRWSLLIQLWQNAGLSPDAGAGGSGGFRTR
jgi:[protein-PII] uridylyltransferase